MSDSGKFSVEITAEAMVVMATKSDWPKIRALIRQSFERLARETQGNSK